jgi:hypothetical protein
VRFGHSQRGSSLGYGSAAIDETARRAKVKAGGGVEDLNRYAAVRELDSSTIE